MRRYLTDCDQSWWQSNRRQKYENSGFLCDHKLHEHDDYALRTACAARLLPLLLLLVLPAVVQAQFTYTTNTDGSLNIYNTLVPVVL